MTKDQRSHYYKTYLFLETKNYSKFGTSNLDSTIEKASDICAQRIDSIQDKNFVSYKKAIEIIVQSLVKSDIFKTDKETFLKSVKSKQLGEFNLKFVQEEINQMFESSGSGIQKRDEKKSITPQDRQTIANCVVDIFRQRNSIYNINQRKEENKLKLLNKYIKNIKKNFSQIISILYKNGRGINLNELFPKIKNLNDAEEIKTISLQNLSKLYQIFFHISIKKFIGKYTEEILAFAKSFSTDEINIAINKSLKKRAGINGGQIVGEDRSTISKTIVDKDGEITLSATNQKTQNKIDVIITLKTGEELNISAKGSAQGLNKEGKYDYQPHLQSVSLETNIWQLSQEFYYHWVNLHLGSNGDIIAEKKAADGIVEKHVAYEALAMGNLTKKNINPADVFTYIDWKRGKVYMESTKSLLGDISNFDFQPSVSSIDLENDNKKVDPGATGDKLKEAITKRKKNVRDALHKKKIEVAFNINKQEAFLKR